MKKDIVFFDTETTGVDVVNDRIVELSMIKRFSDGSPSVTKTIVVNPTIPIHPKASEVHGFTNEMVADKPTFKQYANGIYEFIKGCDIGGFNSNMFDIPLLYNELLRCGIDWDYSESRFIDVGNIYKRLFPRTLESAVKNFLGREHDGAHGAEKDTIATIDVFDYFLELGNEELPTDLDELHLYCNYDKPILDVSGKFTLNDDNDIIFNFGAKKGELASENISYVEWMLYKASFSEDTNKICRKILNVN